MTFDQKLQEWAEHLRICGKSSLVEITPKQAKELSELLEVALNELKNLNEALCAETKDETPF